jgi:Ferritin-like domain
MIRDRSRHVRDLRRVNRPFITKGGAGFLAGGVLFSGLVSPVEAAVSTHHRSKKHDVKIGNSALTLEYLEAELSKRAVASGAITAPELRHFANVTGAHEAAHVKAGCSARRRSGSRRSTSATPPPPTSGRARHSGQRSATGASSKCELRCSSATRAAISSPVSVSMRSGPNASTLKEAQAVP